MPRLIDPQPDPHEDDALHFGEELVGLPVPAHGVTLDDEEEEADLPGEDDDDDVGELGSFPVVPRNARFLALEAQYNQQAILIEEARRMRRVQRRIAGELDRIRSRIPTADDYRQINEAAVANLQKSLEGISTGLQGEVSRAFAIYITAVNIDGSIDRATRVGQWLAAAGETVRKEPFDSLRDIVAFLNSGKAPRRAAAATPPPPVQSHGRAMFDQARRPPHDGVQLHTQLTANDVLVFLQMADEVALLLADSHGSTPEDRAPG
jgi:hypothetical protein